MHEDVAETHAISSANVPAFRKPRVVFMIVGLELSGAERQFQELVARIPRQRWDVRLVVTLLPASDPVSLNGVPVVSLAMRRGVPDPRVLRRAWKVLQTERPDIVVTFMFHASLLSWLLRPFMGSPALVASVRGENIGSRLRELITAAGRGLGDCVTVNAHSVAERLIRAGILPSGRTVVVPNGIDAQTFRNVQARDRTRADLGVRDGTFLWLSAGRFDTAKDQTTLLRAFAANENSHSVLALAGRGPLQQALEQLAIDLGVGGRVRFLGFRRDIAELLSASDAFVLASMSEGLPNSVMEAMAAGKAVIATDVGGVGELVRHGLSGRLVPRGDAAALAAAMLEYETMPTAALSAFGNAGARFVERTLQWPAVILQWEHAMARALALRSRTADVALHITTDLAKRGLIGPPAHGSDASE
jgi:glycosyltransferase involved in cell wall biosynthesis